MAEPSLLRFAVLPVFERGKGIQTVVFSCKEIGARITSGVTRFPPGTGIPLHTHNCDEQTTVLETLESSNDLNRSRSNPAAMQAMRQSKRHPLRVRS